MNEVKIVIGHERIAALKEMLNVCPIQKDDTLEISESSMSLFNDNGVSIVTTTRTLHPPDESWVLTYHHL
jgi:hypothetical protein